MNIETELVHSAFILCGILNYVSLTTTPTTVEEVVAMVTTNEKCSKLKRTYPSEYTV